jgi:hypothetical protein
VTSDASVAVNVQPVLSIALERSTVDFGNVLAGTTPAPISEHVTVVSNDSAGYSVSVHRSAFSPSDLPLALSASAPTGGVLGSSLVGGALIGIPIAPASDLLIGTTAAASSASGDTWGTNLGFATALPIVPAGHYSSTVTFTAIGR